MRFCMIFGIILAHEVGISDEVIYLINFGDEDLKLSLIVANSNNLKLESH